MEKEVAVLVMLCQVGDDCCQYFPLTHHHQVMETGELQVETVRERLSGSAGGLMLTYLERRLGDMREPC